MNNDLIEKFCEKQKIPAGNYVRIDFKKRNPLFGIIVQASDYEDLKSKNFWRIVMHQNIANWTRTKDMEMAKIYNGAEFTKLSVVEMQELMRTV